MIVKELLVEKLRPKEISQLILTKRVKNLVTNLEKEVNQNLLLEGGPGTGKSSVSRILASKYDTLWLNISDENGIETIRTKIIDFCQNRSIDQVSDMKLVILDEIDYGTANFFAALRGTIESYSKYTRFIATCNHSHKVPNEIKSRLIPIKFDPIDDEERDELKVQWKNTLSIILQKFSITYDDVTINHLIDGNLPDFRRTLNKIQELKNSGATDLSSLIKDSKLDESLFDLYKMILVGQVDSAKTYQFIVSRYSKMSEEILEKLGDQFINYILKFYPDKGYLINKTIVLVAKYQYRRSFTLDKVINLIALIFELQNVFRDK